MDKEKIILQGGGDHAHVVLDCLLEQSLNVIAIFDPRLSGDLFGVRQMGSYNPDFQPEAKAIIAIGDNKIRKKVAEITQHRFSRAIHSTAVLSSRCQIGEGSMVLHKTVVQANTVIGKHVIINTAAQVDHDCSIGDYVHLGPGSILCGSVTIGTGTFIGAGTVIIPGIKIGKWSIVGAGSVVTRDIPDFVVAVGHPAKAVKELPQ